MAKTFIVGGDNVPDPDVVVLFGQRYKVRRVTRSVQKALEQVDKKLSAATGEENSDKVVGLMAEGMDALLTADEHDASAKDVLMGAWKEDRLSLGDIGGLYDDIQESAAARPT